MVSLLTTLGWIAVIVGVVLLLVGYLAQARAIRPGWAALIVGLVLLLIGYLIPAITTADPDYDADHGANASWTT